MYVDDVFVILKSYTRKAEDLLNKTNVLHSNINLAIEKEFNSRVEFSIYRQPTQTDHIIKKFPITDTHIKYQPAIFMCIDLLTFL